MRGRSVPGRGVPGRVYREEGNPHVHREEGNPACTPLVHRWYTCYTAGTPLVHLLHRWSSFYGLTAGPHAMASPLVLISYRWSSPLTAGPHLMAGL